MDEKVIVVEGLIKRFGQLTAVDGVSLSVRKGEVFGILGPNGAGKTTLLECVEGLQRPDAGSLHVLGLDVGREASAVKDRIGVQLQASAYFDFLTVTEILELLGTFYSRRVPAAALLGRVSLEDKAGATIRKLSGGQKQRFAIAATLVNDPEVVFLDEPTTGLDPQARRNLWGFISDVREGGRTVVLTTHYMEEAQALCDRVAIMDRGKVVALDTPSNLIQSLPAPYEIRVSLGDGLNAAPCPRDPRRRRRHRGWEGLDHQSSVPGVCPHGPSAARLGGPRPSRPVAPRGQDRRPGGGVPRADRSGSDRG